eukprot:CAMPEP_0196601152 /NCGR_PEP_ID=MMETSP1081-20130531/95759_1 /TAXON_ID=36882 /ORGANISM="Pyramimonas amylifera, Strain CCMP720" /LENGTH=370 /DNA_ID=CAMNT_0041927019 /DNA_START=618 /DNA_END=1730 /DNA_ORIENTATION=-
MSKTQQRHQLLNPIISTGNNQASPSQYNDPTKRLQQLNITPASPQRTLGDKPDQQNETASPSRLPALHLPSPMVKMGTGRRTASSFQEELDSPMTHERRIQGLRRWHRTQKEAQLQFKSKQKEKEQQWLESRNKSQRFEFTFAQKRALRKWFDSMDADGSGDISVHELTDALLSTGIAHNRAEAEKLFWTVDSSGTGEIDFDEFLGVLNPSANAKSASANMLSTENLQEFIANDDVEDDLEIGSKVNEKRRKLLLDTITSLYAIPSGLDHSPGLNGLRRTSNLGKDSTSARTLKSVQAGHSIRRSSFTGMNPDVRERRRQLEQNERDKDREKNEKHALLSNLLEAVERWKEREGKQFKSSNTFEDIDEET